MYLTTSEAAALDQQVAGVEARTGVQVVAAVVGKSDSYVELPWKAFALGASIAALLVVAADAVRPEWATSRTALLHVVEILGAGAACALAAVFLPPFARLFLRRTRSEVEVRQYAESLFLRKGLFATPARRSVLVFVSLFERRLEILADVGLREKVSEADWQGIAGRMTPRLAEGRASEALQEAVAALESLLVERGLATGSTANELPNRPIEEAGA